MFDGIASLDELTQLVLIEFIRKDAVLNLGNKVRFWRGSSVIGLIVFSHFWCGG